MADQFVGEIRLFAGNFAPSTWALCNGQQLPVQQNTQLFSLLRYQFGGNGADLFALPDLRGRTPLGAGQGSQLSNRALGDSGGSATVRLDTSQLPSHAHSAAGSRASGTSTSPAAAVWATAHYGRRPDQLYSTSAPTIAMSPLSSSGGGAAHNNRVPFLGVTFIIALAGDYPPNALDD